MIKWKLTIPQLTKLFIAMSTVFAITINAAPSTVADWEYSGATGPQHWSQLSPSFQICNHGKTQSPIDIESPLIGANNQLKIHYQASANVTEYRASQIILKRQNLVLKDDHTIQLNFPESATNEFITLAGKKYQLVQFHFHTPSENYWHGKKFAGEIHFVNQSVDGQLAVVGVWIVPGKSNAELDRIITNLPHGEKQSHTFVNEKVNPATLLPQDHAYYTFTGSLTTPPCTEGVHWMMMATPITASLSQIEKLQQAMEQNNARPLQPLNDRKVLKINT